MRGFLDIERRLDALVENQSKTLDFTVDGNNWTIQSNTESLILLKDRTEFPYKTIVTAIYNDGKYLVEYEPSFKDIYEFLSVSLLINSASIDEIKKDINTTIAESTQLRIKDRLKLPILKDEILAFRCITTDYRTSARITIREFRICFNEDTDE